MMKSLHSLTAWLSIAKHQMLMLVGSTILLPTLALAQPSNDNCNSAIVLTPNTTCATTAATSVNATASLPQGVLCNGDPDANADDDVWFSFTAQSPVHNITVIGSVSYDAVIELYMGGCGSAILACKDFTGGGGSETISRSNYVVGQTYFFRVYHYGAGSGSGTFDVCVQTLPPPVKLTSTPAGGLWNDPNTWLQGRIPEPTDSVVISNGATVSINEDATIAHLQIGSNNTPSSNAILTFSTFATRVLTVTGDILIGDGDNFLAYGNGTFIRNVYIAGNLINNGYANFTRSNTAVIFNGDLPQQIGGTGTYEGGTSGKGVFRQISVNNSTGGLTINRPIAATLAFALVEGTLTTNNNLTLDHTIAIPSVTSPPSIIFRRGNGSVNGALNVPSNVVYNVSYQSFVSNVVQPNITGGTELINGYINALTMDRPGSTVTLTKSLHLKATGTALTLTNGFLKIANADDTLKALNAANIPTGSANSFVEGALSSIVNGTITRTYPMGTNGQYRPVVLNNISGTNATYVVQTLGAPSGAYNAPLTNVMGTRAYKVSANTTFPSTATITLAYDADDNFYGDINSLRIAQANALTGTWTERSAASSTGTLLSGTRTTNTGISLNNGNFFAFATTTVLDDASATSISAPLTKSCYSSNETISVVVKNVGTSPITNVPVKVRVTFVGQTNSTNVYSTSVASIGASSTATANVTVNMSAYGQYYVRAYTDLATDGNRNNDTTATSLFTYSVPVITGLTNFCSGASTTLSIASPNPNTTYLWSNGSTGNSISVTNAGSYSVQAISGACTSAASTAVQVTTSPSPSAPTAVASGNTTICGSGTVTLSVQSPAANTTYTWSNGVAGASITVGNTGNFSVRAISAGCTSAASNVIAVNIGTLPNTPTISTSSPISLCGGTNALLNVQSPAGNLTYLWSNGSTGSSITVGNSGSYTVQAIANGCTSAVSNAVVVNVTSPAIPTLAATGATTFCAGGSVTIGVQTPAANTTYLWSNGTTANSITVSAAGNYTAQAISNSCTSAVSNAVAVTVNPTPVTPTVAATGATTFCGSGSATINVSSPVANTSYLWSNGTTANSITVTAAGNYSVRAIANGCTSAVSNAVAVTINPTPATPSVAASGATTFCGSGSATINVSSPVANTTYLWSNGTTANSITVIAAGSYSVRAIANGCTSAVSNAVAVTINPTPATPSVAASGATTFCGSGSATINVSSPVANTTYLWSNGTTANSITVTAAGSYSARAISNGCTSAVSNAVAVTINPTPATPSVAASGATAFCSGGSVTINVSSPVANTTYLWSNGTTANSITASTSGNYTVQAISNGCTSAVSNAVAVTVNIPFTLSISQTNVSVCGANDGAINLTVNGAVGTPTFAWTKQGDATFNASTEDLNNLSAGAYSVTVSQGGCSVTQSVTITEGTVGFTLSSSQTNPSVCGGTDGAINLTVISGMPPFAFSWTKQGSATVISSVEDPNNLSAGTYNVTVSQGACSATLSVTLTDPTPTVATIAAGSATTFCAGGNVILSVENPATGATYLWSNGTTANSITVSTAGNFTVQTILGTCTSAVSNAIAVTVNPVPTAPSISGTTSFCDGGNTTLSISSPAANATYLWSNGTTANSINVSAAGSFTVQAISNGCTSTVSAATVVSVNPVPTAPSISGTTSFCDGGNTTLSISNPAANTTYLWSNGTTANSITVSAAGSFTVQAIANGCTSAVSAATVVTVNPLPMAMISQNGNVVSVMEVPNATYQWLLEGQPITNATGVNHTALVNGNYSIRVTLNGCSAVSNVIAVVVISVANRIDASVKIFPNPSAGTFTLSVENLNNVNIRITDILGKTIYTANIVSEQTALELPKGVYFLQINSREGATTQRVVIQ